MIQQGSHRRRQARLQLLGRQQQQHRLAPSPQGLGPVAESLQHQAGIKRQGHQAWSLLSQGGQGLGRLLNCERFAPGQAQGQGQRWPRFCLQRRHRSRRTSSHQHQRALPTRQGKSHGFLY